MQEKYRVLLPKWVFKPADVQEQQSLIKKYMQRYPHYVFLNVKDGIAVCERITLKTEKE